MQSKEHTLPSSGKRFTPKETPNLLLCTGPKTISLNRIVDIFFLFTDYKNNHSLFL